MKWEPIESAPRDGTHFLGWSPGEDGFVVWWCHPDDNSFMHLSYEWYETERPTHWMPLPPPPETE